MLATDTQAAKEEEEIVGVALLAECQRSTLACGPTAPHGPKQPDTHPQKWRRPRCARIFLRRSKSSRSLLSSPFAKTCAAEEVASRSEMGQKAPAPAREPEDKSPRQPLGPGGRACSPRAQANPPPSPSPSEVKKTRTWLYLPSFTSFCLFRNQSGILY